MHLDTRERALLSTAEASRLLGVAARTVAEMCKAGNIRAVRIGERGRWRVVRASVDQMVRAEPVTSRYGIRESVPIRDEGDAA